MARLEFMELERLMSDRPVVMVVEDDVEMNQLECEFLQVHGLDTVAAYNGVEAVELCHSSDADAVLLDLMLPEIDGFEICRRLRKKQGKDLSIIIVTALDSDDCRQRGYEVGADAYFCKPFNPDEVIQTICLLLDRHSEQKSDSADSDYEHDS